MENLIRSQDLFGHYITLNLEKRSSTHKTCIGGFFSIILKLLVFIYMLTVIILLSNKKYGV